MHFGGVLRPVLLDGSTCNYIIIHHLSRIIVTSFSYIHVNCVALLTLMLIEFHLSERLKVLSLYSGTYEAAN
jgi:hypothetical protein